MKNVINRLHITIERGETQDIALARVQKEYKLSDEQIKNYKLIFYDESSPVGITYKNMIGKAL